MSRRKGRARPSGASGARRRVARGNRSRCQAGPTGRALRWGCLTLAVALAGVGVLIGVGVVPGLIYTYVHFAPSSADRARVRVMSRERILQGRPVGFARIRGVTRNVTKKELFGGVGENSVEVGDVVSVSSLTAAGDLLRLAQADGWVTGDHRCDLSREFPLAHQ